MLRPCWLRATDSPSFLHRALPLVSSNLQPGHVIGWMTTAAWRFLLAPAGILTLGVTLLPGGRGVRVGDDDSERRGAVAVPSREERRAQKKAGADAARMAKKGMPAEAAELCITAGLLNDAADYFLKANLYERAAEIRHDQNRFLESAELYAKAGKPDSAGAIYAQQEKWDLSAEAYVVAET